MPLNLGVNPDAVGFTGTQRGTTARQDETLCGLLLELEPVRAHHGDCIGADAAFHRICLDQGILVYLHPPTDAKKRAFCAGCQFVHAPRPYLERNRDIVLATVRLIACPGEFEEQLRSGTWSTVRFARKLRRPVCIIFPDGSVQKEGERQ